MLLKLVWMLPTRNARSPVRHREETTPRWLKNSKETAITVERSDFIQANVESRRRMDKLIWLKKTPFLKGCKRWICWQLFMNAIWLEIQGSDGWTLVRPVTFVLIRRCSPTTKNWMENNYSWEILQVPKLKEKGKVTLNMTSDKELIFNNVLHVLDIRENLVSGSLLSKNDFKFVFVSKFVLTKNEMHVGKWYMWWNVQNERSYDCTKSKHY